MANRQESLVARIGLDSTGFKSGLNDVMGQLKNFASQAAQISAGIGGASLVQKVVEKLFELGKEAFEYARKTKQTSEAIGITTGMLQTFQVAVRRTGEESEEATKGLDHLAVHVGEARAGNVEAIKKFNDLGIAIYSADGKARALGDILKDLSAKIRGAADGEERARIAFEAFGKEGVKLIPAMLNNLGDLNKELEESGRIIKERNIVALEQMEKTIKRILSTGGLKGAFGNLLGEALGSSAGELRAQLRLLGDVTDAVRVKKKGTVANLLDGSGPYGAKLRALTPEQIEKANHTLEELSSRVESMRQHGLSDAQRQAELSKQIIDDRVKAEKLAGKERQIAEEKIKLLMMEERELSKKIGEDQAKIRHEIGKAVAEKAKESQNLTTEKSNRYKFASIADLMAVDPNGGDDQQNAFIQNQQGRERLADQYHDYAVRAQLHGRDDLAQRAEQGALDIRKHISSLQSGVRDPYAAIEEHMKASQAAIEELTKLAKANGLNVNIIAPRNL